MEKENNKIVKISDMEKIFTKELMAYLSEGYTIYSEAMSGSQGEKAKVAVRKNKEVYVIRIETNIYRNEKYSSIDTIELVIKRYNEKYFSNIYWNSEGEEIKKVVFYKLGYSSSVYTNDKEYCIQCLDKKYDRREARTSHEKNIKYNSDIILNILHKKNGYKRVKTNDIMKVMKEGKKYHIVIKGKKDVYIG